MRAGSSGVDQEWLELIPDAVVVVDENARIIQANVHCAEMFGTIPGQLIGRSVDDLVPPELRERHRSHQEAFLAHPHRRPMGAGMELWAARPSGERFPVEISLSPIERSGRRLVMAAIRDVSARHQTLRALQASEDRFRRLFHEAPIGKALLRYPGWGLIDYNPSFARLAGRPPSELSTLSLLDLVDPLDTEAVRVSLVKVAATTSSLRFETRLIAGVVRRWVRVAASPAGPVDGPIAEVIVQIEDVTAEREAEEHLAHLALHDVLTGLPNRALALDRIAQAQAEADRTGNWLAVGFVDLDNFKVVNDSLGHDAGDQLLQQVAERLSAALRPADTVARFGGDEFVICLPGLGADRQTAESEAVAVVDRLRSQVDGSYDVDGAVLHVESSWGLSVNQGGRQRPDDILRDADTAMYLSKQQGRGRLSLFDAPLRARAVQRLSLETRLRHALDAGQFCLFYQPIVDLDGSVVSSEALLRWSEPGEAIHLPAAFLDVAEDVGLIVPLGLWIVEQVCRDLAGLRAKYGDRHDSVALNLSVRQLQRSAFSSELAAICRGAGVDPSRLVIEVSERAVMDTAGSVNKQLRELDDLGVVLALDDFGTGYGSLTYLRKLPIGEVKIDRTFVERLPESAEDVAIAKAVSVMAEALGLVTVAEGVETPQQLASVQEIGIAQAQGFYLGQPEPLLTPMLT